MKKTDLSLCNGTITCTVVFSISQAVRDFLHPLEDSINGSSLAPIQYNVEHPSVGGGWGLGGGGEAESGLIGSSLLHRHSLLNSS